MAEQKKKYETIISPRGVAAFAWLDKPDSGREFSDDKYKVTLILPQKGAENQDEIDALVAKINAEHTRARGKKKTESPVKDGDEKDKPEFAGKWLLTFKGTKAPAVVDAKKKAISAEGAVYSGDVIKVAFALVEYEHGKNAGVTLGLRAVQLLEKNARAAFGADAFGEEDGYESAEDSAASPASRGRGDDDEGDFA